MRETGGIMSLGSQNKNAVSKVFELIDLDLLRGPEE